MLPNIKIPEKIIVTCGLPRSGKSMMRDILGSHSQIAHIPSAFAFFNWFSEEKYRARGGYCENLEYFFKHCRKSSTWNLTAEMVEYSGQERRDLYLTILETYRNTYYPSKKYVAEYTHLAEVHFDTLVEWFGMERLKFIQIIRNPYDNYSSYVKSRGISDLDRNENRYDSFVHKFCNMWGQSATFGIYRNIKYKNAYRVIFFEDIKKNPEIAIKSLCKWIGIPNETENMMYNKDKLIIQNSAFIKTDVGRKEIIKKDNYDRSKHLSNYEKDVIKKMNCPNLLNAMDYEKQEVVKDFKHVPLDLDTLEYERAIPFVIRTYLSPLPPKKAINISAKIILESFKLFFSVSILLTKRALYKFKRLVRLVFN